MLSETEARAGRWLQRAAEQIDCTQSRLGGRVATRLERLRDPRDAQLMLAQLVARRLLPAPRAPRRELGESTLHGVSRALARLRFADRAALWTLRGQVADRRADVSGCAAAGVPGGASGGVGTRARSLSQRAALRRLAETYGELKRGAAIC